MSVTRSPAWPPQGIHAPQDNSDLQAEVNAFQHRVATMLGLGPEAVKVSIELKL